MQVVLYEMGVALSLLACQNFNPRLRENNPYSKRLEEAMNCFQLVKQVLDELYQDFSQPSEDKKDGLINKALAYLENELKALEKILPNHLFASWP